MANLTCTPLHEDQAALGKDRHGVGERWENAQLSGTGMGGLGRGYRDGWVGEGGGVTESMLQFQFTVNDKRLHNDYYYF